MKIRKGFVSNSSTSSFILIGEKVTSKEIIDAYEKCEDFNETVLVEEDYYEMCETLDNFFYVDEDFYKGILLADWSNEGYLTTEEFNLSSLLTKINDIKNPKLYYGTYAS